jgi:hypothetical protein
MKSVLITLAAGTAVLLLSGCPDIPGGPVPGAQSDSPWQSSSVTHARHEGATHAGDGAAHNGAGDQHDVSEIAWFQGTIDEAFSRRGCPQSRPRRGLFRF